MNTDQSNASQLLGRIFSEISNSNYSTNTNILDEFIKDFDSANVNTIFKNLYEDLRTNILGVSALGNFEQPLKALLYLVNYPAAAQVLVNHERWLPKGDTVDGRVIEVISILGPFFHVGVLPDHAMFKSFPDVGKQCFSSLYRHPAELPAAFAAIRSAMNKLYDGLAQILLCLLKNTSTREGVLEFLAEVINKNSARAHMQVDQLSCASTGMFMNLSAVMLRLCQPFLDENMTKSDKIDPKYVSNDTRLDFRGLTALNASSSQVAEWFINNKTEQESKYSFITECFFMTARVLNLSLIKGLSAYNNLVQQIENHEYTLASLKSMQKLFKLPSDTRLDECIAHLEQELEIYSQEKLCYEAQIIEDKGFIHRAVSFYRLMVVWSVGLVGGFELSSPSTCPKEFASLPEHFVEDAMELLLFASRNLESLEELLHKDFMNFIIVFMASPEYIRNPYLRAKMVEVLHSWMPSDSGRSSVAVTLFEGHQFSLKFLVRNLLKVYVDMEFTGNSHTQFYDKFDIRHKIAELLQYLWQIPGHRKAWLTIAKEEEKWIYLNFLKFLVNDSIYLLDESLTEILEMKILEAEMCDTKDLEKTIRMHMKSANEDVNMLAYTSEQIAVPFLLPEMVERVASMLNFFLLKLVGPERKNLKLKDPARYEFFPKHLLKQIVNIYVNLERGDKANIFPAAIAKDGGTYNEVLFNAAPSILRKIGEDERVIQEFVELGQKAKAAANETLDAEAALGEIPEEFLDPLQYTLMKDPVILPSGITVDRSVIVRHLLSFNTDPFNHSHLTVDMLESNVALKSQIHEFIRSRELKQDSEDCS